MDAIRIRWRRSKVMKRLISAALALSLLGATAASAAPVNGPLVPVDYRDHSYRHHDNGAGVAVAAGIGLFALGAILASQNHDRDDGYYRDRDDGYRDYGYRDYDRGYGYSQPYGGYSYSSPYNRGW